MVVRRAQEQKVPIRIGVNAGSLERRLLEKYGYPTPEAMVESALYHIQILEDLGFTDTIISLKASNVKLTRRRLSPALPAGGLPLASGHHGGRHAVFRHGQVVRGHGNAAGGRHRRHDSRFAGHRSRWKKCAWASRC